METRVARTHGSSASSSISRSRSPLSDNGKRSISTSPRQGPSTPMKSLRQRNDSDEEQGSTNRAALIFNDDSKVINDETSSAMMSDTEETSQKKRSHHRHHHRHHKQVKTNKRSATHQKQSVKRRYGDGR